MLALQQGIEAQSQRDLDGFAGRPGGGDDDDPPAWMKGLPIGVGVGREQMIASGDHGRKGKPPQREMLPPRWGGTGLGRHRRTGGVAPEMQPADPGGRNDYRLPWSQSEWPW